MMKTPPFSARLWSSVKPDAPMMKSATGSVSAVDCWKNEVRRPDTDDPKNAGLGAPAAVIVNRIPKSGDASAAADIWGRCRTRRPNNARVEAYLAMARRLPP